MAHQEQKDTLDRYEGKPVVSSDGEHVGKLADIYFDDATDRPEWALVTTGRFGGRHSFAPLTNAALGDEIHLGVTKEQVDGAPNIDDDGELSQDEEQELARHYGMTYSTARSESGLPEDDEVRRPAELVRRRRPDAEVVVIDDPVAADRVVLDSTPVEQARRDEAGRR